MINNISEEGFQMYTWAKGLFPLNRSLTGDGVRETLNYIRKIIPSLELKRVKSGTTVFDWTVPKEWKVKDAYIIKPDGTKIANFKENNLHLVGYSASVNKELSLAELLEHIHTREDIPNAIPYVTSYYDRVWGFCITELEKRKLEDGIYKVLIDTEFMDGNLDYAELTIPGNTKKQILISTYICHPSMANNELSGPVVTTMLAKWLLKKKKLRYTYKLVFVPETIGAIAYIHNNYNQLRNNTLGGFVVSCVGDNNSYSILQSKVDDSLINQIGLNVVRYCIKDTHKEYCFLDRGSDERQYSSPGVDIPMISLMRSKYGEYIEYHTSLDNLDFISPSGLFGGLEMHKMAIDALEYNFFYKVNIPCEPQLGKRGLYPNISKVDGYGNVKNMMDILSYLDGTMDLVSISNFLSIPFYEVYSIIKVLVDDGLISKVDTL